ncbi:MAG TPA: dynamin family protein [Verrucomicrobiaceae bacterium]|jgi:small GTP-binding protein
MIGQDYFDLRSRVGSALLALREIAPDIGTGDEAATIDATVSGMKDPFMFVVVGEVNVGKSTLLNALFGADLSKTGVMPTTEKIYWFKHGEELRRVPLTRTIEEVRVPVEFLRDFSVVDTPGTNSIENEHQEFTERFVPTADLVIFVFSAMNPWGASAWQFLARVHQDWMRNILFVLQQCDLREPEEIQSILAYMRKLSARRFGREFPIFPVSAKRAYLARSAGLDRDRLLVESGFQNLERHISQTISGNDGRHGKLSGALETGRRMLGAMQSEFESRRRQRLERAARLRAIDEGLSHRAQRTFDQVSHVSETAANALKLSVQNVFAVVAGELTARKALESAFKEKRSFAGIEKQVQEQINGGGEERWNQAAAIFEDDVGAAADQVHAQLTENLNVPPGEDLRPDAVFWVAQRGRFLSLVHGVQQRASSKLEISRRLEPCLRSSRRLAQAQWIAAAVGVLVAAGFAVAGWWVVTAAAALVAALAFLALGRMNSQRLTSACAASEAQFSSAPVEMKDLLDRQLRDETQDLYQGFDHVLQPLREELAAQERRHAALQSQMENLARTFEGIEADLKPGAARRA